MNIHDNDGCGGTQFGRTFPRGTEEAVARYASMDRDALSEELMREAAALRAKGMLDVERLEEFCRTAAPYLTTEQLRRMRELIAALR